MDALLGDLGLVVLEKIIWQVLISSESTVSDIL